MLRQTTYLCPNFQLQQLPVYTTPSVLTNIMEGEDLIMWLSSVSQHRLTNSAQRKHQEKTMRWNNEISDLS